VHLVGCTIRIYYDARTYERQTYLLILCQRYLLQIGSLIHSSRYVLHGTLNITYEYLYHLVALNQDLHKHVLKWLPLSFLLFIFF